MSYQRKNIFSKTVQFRKAHILDLFHHLGQNGSLTFGTLIIGITDIADTRIGYCLYTGAGLCPTFYKVIAVWIQLSQITHLCDVIIGNSHFIIGKCQFHTTQLVNDIDHAVKINRYITIHLNLVVLCHCFQKQRTGTIGMGCIQFSHTDTGNIHIGITHQRNHADLLFLIIQRHQDHTV